MNTDTNCTMYSSMYTCEESHPGHHKHYTTNLHRPIVVFYQCLDLQTTESATYKRTKS